MDDATKRRLKNLSNQCVHLPVITLISQLYTLTEQNWDAINDGHEFSVQKFEEMFQFQVLQSPVQILFYDEETQSFFVSTIPRVKIQQIKAVPLDDEGELLSAYEVDILADQSIEYRGSAEVLFEIAEEIRWYIQAGWERVREHHLFQDAGSTIRPCGNVSPFDLVACANFFEISQRTLWFVAALLHAKSPYSQYIMPTKAIVDRYDIMAMNLFVNTCLRVYANAIKPPNDFTPFRRYIANGTPIFNEIRIDKRSWEAIQRAKKLVESVGGSFSNKLPDYNLNDLRIIDMTKPPELFIDILTNITKQPVGGNNGNGWV